MVRNSTVSTNFSWWQGQLAPPACFEVIVTDMPSQSNEEDAWCTKLRYTPDSKSSVRLNREQFVVNVNADCHQTGSGDFVLAK